MWTVYNDSDMCNSQARLGAGRVGVGECDDNQSSADCSAVAGTDSVVITVNHGVMEQRYFYSATVNNADIKLCEAERQQ